MVLGVFLHAANIYSINKNWIVTDPNQSYVFNFINDSIHAFRMPLFFWISGYFCALTASRSSTKTFFEKRIPRLAIPLLSAWLTLNLLQEYFLNYLRSALSIDAREDYFNLYHLWFLFDLLVFTVAYPALSLFVDRIHSHIVGLGKLSATQILLVLTVISFATGLGVRATGVAYETIWGATSLYRLAIYMPFFLAGSVMFKHPELRFKFQETPIYLFCLGVTLKIILARYEADRNFLISESANFVGLLATWICTATALEIFNLIFSRPSARLRHMSDAAYSIYIFHHLVVIAVGALLISSTANIYLKYVLVCLLGFGVPAAIHYFAIRNVRLLSFLYNGSTARYRVA